MTERHWSEREARRWLERRGFVFLAGNAVLPGSELDLVMLERGTVVIVEVRQRRDDRFGGPAASLDGAKLRRLWSGARAFARRRYGHTRVAMRIDAVLITGTRERFRLVHLRDVARDLGRAGEG